MCALCGRNPTSGHDGGQLLVNCPLARSRGGTLPRASSSLRDLTRQVRGEPRFANRRARESPAQRARVVSEADWNDCLFVTPKGFPRRTSRAMLPSMVRRYAAARRKQTRSQRLRARYARADGPPVSLARSRSQSASRSRGDPRAPRRFDPPAFANDAFGAFDKFRILTPSPTGRNCSSSPPL